MVRELLGNIRGPRGLEGPKGEDGGFNGETIGVNNLIDLSELTPYDPASKIEPDIKNGIVNYSNAAYYMRQTRHLNKGVHSFTVKDYTSNESVYNGRIRIEVNDPSTSVRALLQDIDKGAVVVFDVPESKVYQINIRIAGVERLSGFIEKPMLVEGEYVSGFQLSEKDRFNLNSLSNFSYYRMYDSGFSNGVEKRLKTYFNSGVKLEYDVDNGLVLEQGSWMVTWNFQSVTEAPGVIIKILLDNEEIARGVTDTGYYSLSRVVHVPQGTTGSLTFTVTPPENSNLTMGPDRRNNTQIKKL